MSGIIIFSKEAQFEIEDIPEKFDGMTKFAILGVDENEEFITKAYRRTSIEKLDQLAAKFVKEFEKRYGVRAVYLVRHLDETAPHYHFLFENLRDNRKMLSNTFVKPSVIQKGKARPYQRNVRILLERFFLKLESCVERQRNSVLQGERGNISRTCESLKTLCKERKSGFKKR